MMFESQRELLIVFHGKILFFVSVPFKSGSIAIMELSMQRQQRQQCKCHKTKGLMSKNNSFARGF